MKYDGFSEVGRESFRIAQVQQVNHMEYDRAEDLI